MAAAIQTTYELRDVRPQLSLVEPPALDPSARVVAAEQALEAHDYALTLDLLDGVVIPAGQLALRALLTESWAQLSLGRLPHAFGLLERARTLSEQPACSDVDRAEVLFQLGCYRLTVGAVGNAVSLLTLALDLCDRSPLPCDRLRARALDWRSRCYQRQRDWSAARADVERGLELAQSLGDDATLAQIYFQASVVAERESQWLLARFYAEEARTMLERLGDWPNVGKALNNLGGLNFLLGDSAAAVACLDAAVSIAAERGSHVDTGYAVSSLAQIQLRGGYFQHAERDARRALDLLDGRVDHLGEVGGAQVVLARALAALGRLEEADEACCAAEESFRLLGSASHSATAWLAHGDIARTTGDVDRAADFYRQAAEALQDVHF